jgi:hypothetical protein
MPMTLKKLEDRKAPLIVSALVATTGMLYSFFWLRLTMGGFYHRFWLTPGDMWNTYRTATWVGWGAYGSLYFATGGYLTTPGLAIVLAPLTVLTRALGMSEAFPYMIPHPTAWVLLGPVEILLGCTCLFALDALAQRLEVSRSRRRVLCIVQGLLVWPLLVMWGHPEDAIAIALAAYAMIAALDRRWTPVGWLLGAAIAFQPLVVLVVPLVLARGGKKQALGLLGRAFGPSGVLMVVPFLTDFRDTWRSVVEQPTDLVVAHVTPWTSLAPRIIAAGVVSCGPTRLVAIAGSCGLAWLVGRHRPEYSWLVWCAAVCMGLRFVTESAVEPYYIWPALALFVIAASTQRTARFLLTCAIAIGLTIATDMHYGTWWIWWGVCALGLALVSASSFGKSRLPAPTADTLDAADLGAELRVPSFLLEPVP